ncbi:MAG: pyridoxal-phosphate dependent enzyme, partial [Promethearchaeota archaeon]
RMIFTASSGNIGASISAYSARAGLITRVFSPKSIDVGKKSQILNYGGVLLDHFTNLNDAINSCLTAQIQENAYQATPELNPLSIFAQKTISYEIYSSGMVPDEVYISMGNGGTLFSIWQGFDDLIRLGLLDRVPRIIGISIIRKDETRILPLRESQDFTQLDLAKYALDASGGLSMEVNEYDVSRAISLLARTEGLFVEPASAAAYAGLLKSNDKGDDGLKKIVILTGTGLKAPFVIDALIPKKTIHFSLQKKMNLRLTILEQLNAMDSLGGLHGYGIFQNIKNKCSKQAVYQHLKKLEERNFIVSHKDENGRKIYKITTNGKKVLDLLQQLIDLV